MFQYGLEKMFKSRPESSLGNPYSVLPALLDDVDDGELSKIHELSLFYNDQKNMLLNNMSSENKLQLFKHDVMDGITNEVIALLYKKQSIGSKQ